MASLSILILPQNAKMPFRGRTKKETTLLITLRYGFGGLIVSACSSKGLCLDGRMLTSDEVDTNETGIDEIALEST